eukprot:1509276-Rhodomonas_salina.2
MAPGCCSICGAGSFLPGFDALTQNPCRCQTTSSERKGRGQSEGGAIGWDVQRRGVGTHCERGCDGTQKRGRDGED